MNKGVWSNLTCIVLGLLLLGGLSPLVADTQDHKLVNEADVERIERSGRIVVLNGIQHYVAAPTSVHDDAQREDLAIGDRLRWAEPEERYGGLLKIEHWERVGTL